MVLQLGFLNVLKLVPKSFHTKNQPIPLCPPQLQRWDSSDQMYIFSVGILANCLDSPYSQRRETGTPQAWLGQTSDMFWVHTSLTMNQGDENVDALTRAFPTCE